MQDRKADPARDCRSETTARDRASARRARRRPRDDDAALARTMLYLQPCWMP
jgi:hypothetical protein